MINFTDCNLTEDYILKFPSLIFYFQEKYHKKYNSQGAATIQLYQKKVFFLICCFCAYNYVGLYRFVAVSK